jgi:hypothetical protein
MPHSKLPGWRDGRSSLFATERIRVQQLCDDHFTHKRRFIAPIGMSNAFKWSSNFPFHSPIKPRFNKRLNISTDDLKNMIDGNVTGNLPNLWNSV